jgi:hypothetical protein
LNERVEMLRVWRDLADYPISVNRFSAITSEALGAVVGSRIWGLLRLSVENVADSE